MLEKHVTQRASLEKNDVANMPVEKEWKLEYDSTTADIVIRQSPEFLSNVGSSSNSLATTVTSPGVDTDGDEDALQQCERCGATADATSSVICDECNKVFHIDCKPSRTEIPEEMDEWFCSWQCKRKWNTKLKRKRKRDFEIQGALLKSLSEIGIGADYQAIIPEASGIDEDQPVDALGEDPVSRFGNEVPLTFEEKQLEKDEAQFNLANNIWPRGWLPAKRIPVGINENWLQCTFVLISMGNDEDVVCGKWRRAPESYESREGEDWECSDAVVWDPYHADCHVPQEISNEEIIERWKKRTLLQAQRSSQQDL